MYNVEHFEGVVNQHRSSSILETPRKKVNLADRSQSRRQGLIQTNSAQLPIRHEHEMGFVIDAIEKIGIGAQRHRPRRVRTPIYCRCVTRSRLAMSVTAPGISFAWIISCMRPAIRELAPFVSAPRTDRKQIEAINHLLSCSRS